MGTNVPIIPVLVAAENSEHTLAFTLKTLVTSIISKFSQQGHKKNLTGVLTPHHSIHM